MEIQYQSTIRYEICTKMVKETIPNICKQFSGRDTGDIDDSFFLDVLLIKNLQLQ